MSSLPDGACGMTSTLFALTGGLAFVLGSLVWVFKR
jgi:hypothetical protein